MPDCLCENLAGEFLGKKAKGLHLKTMYLFNFHVLFGEWAFVWFRGNGEEMQKGGFCIASLAVQ